MNGQNNIIEVMSDLVAEMTPICNITDNVIDGSNYKLSICNTYWMRPSMKITIGGITYKIVSFVQNDYIIVSGASQPIVTTFQLTAPDFEHGSYRKVNTERKTKLDLSKPLVYLPVPEVTEANNIFSDIMYTASIRPLFLISYDQRKDTIELQQEEAIEPCNAMADLFVDLINSKYDKFEEPLDIIRREWMNFGDSTVWGNDKLIFDQPLSGVELRMSLQVLDQFNCECEGESPDVCLGVDIIKNDIYQETVPSGGTYSYTEGGTCDPVTTTFQDDPTATDTPSGENLALESYDSDFSAVGTLTTDEANLKVIEIGDSNNTMNGVSIEGSKPEDTKNFTIQYADGSPVVVTTITNTKNTFLGSVPNAPSLLNSASIYKSGQASGNTQLAGDEGTDSPGRGVSWTVLDFTNPFGNTDRFTDVLGTQIYANDVVLDWASYDPVGETVRSYFRAYQGVSRLDTALASSPYTLVTYSDWHIVTGQQLDKITNYNQSAAWLNYAPFNLSLTTAVWTRTRQGTSRYFQLTTNGYGNAFFSATGNIFLTRQYTLTELGL